MAIRAQRITMPQSALPMPDTPYDAGALSLGPLMVQKTGAGALDNYCGPLPIAVSRPMEASTPIPYAFPWAMRWSNYTDNQKDWVFQADISTAAATRRLGMWEFNRWTGSLDYVGFLTVTFPGTSEAKTIRGLRMSYDLYIDGTVAVSGTAVTGTSTAWLTNRCCVGNRIGFGSTDPKNITTWYEISAIGSDTGITLAASAGTISAGTPYVIEDLRAYMLVTSVTTALGGLYVVKGLNKTHFTGPGGSVPAAVSTDNVKACYFLKDAVTGTLTVGFGMGMGLYINKTSRFMYLLDTLANPILHKHDVYAALTVASGASTSSFLFKTGSGGVLTGAPSQNNNGRVAITSHGPGSGLECVYFTTASRIYRTAAVGTITTGSTSWLADNMTEVPPGGSSTYPLNGALNSIEFSDQLDRFIVMSSGTAGARSYLTQYRTDGGQMDRLLFSDNKQQDQSAADSTSTPYPCQQALPFTSWVEGGMLYLSRFGTTAIINQLYAIPLGADWEFAGSGVDRRSITMPAIDTPNAKSYVAAFVNAVQVIGGTTGKNLGMTTEPFRVYYRTTGITDNSGGWTLLNDTLDMAGVTGAARIQFKLEFRMANTLIPSRILNCGVLYNDNGMSDHWQGSSNVGTDITNKRFGFRHSVAYGGTVPRLKCELFDAESGVSLGSDDSITQAWGWGKSTNSGGAWSAYNSTDRANATTYIRVTPTGLADNIRVRGVVSEY